MVFLLGYTLQVRTDLWWAVQPEKDKIKNINILVWCQLTTPTAIHFYLTPGLDANTQVIFNLQ